MHIRLVYKSIPFYREGHELIVKLSDYFIGSNKDIATCYDLGSSTGCLTYKLAKYHKNKHNITWCGIDQERSMILLAKKRYNNINNIKFICNNFLTLDFKNPSSFIICYYVLQFLNISDRISLLDKIYNTLSKGSGLIVFEKVFANDAKCQDIFHTLHMNLKKDNFFSPSEIYDKTESLKGVLLPNTSEDNLNMFYKIGFSKIHLIMKYLGFEGYLLIK